MSLTQRHRVVRLHKQSRAPSVDQTALALALADRQRRLGDALVAMRRTTGALAQAADALIETLSAGGRVLIAGNGGSAAEAQHFATELVGRFKRERDPYAVIALTADTAILTAVANDYGFAEVFARQVGAYGRPGDVFVAFSTSGESENLVRAAAMAERCGLRTIAITGERPSRLSAAADIAIRVPSADTPLTQELHTITLHLLCDLIEAELAARPTRSAVSR